MEPARLKRAGFFFLLLKGLAKRVNYPEPLLRNPGDIDMENHSTPLVLATYLCQCDGTDTTDSVLLKSIKYVVYAAIYL